MSRARQEALVHFMLAMMTSIAATYIVSHVYRIYDRTQSSPARSIPWSAIGLSVCRIIHQISGCQDDQHDCQARSAEVRVR